MAKQDHLQLANYIKSVHKSLRLSTFKFGVEKAWQEHCDNKDVLTTYSQCMQTLATTHWAVNSENENFEATSRIRWARDFCFDYFVNNNIAKYKERDDKIAKIIGVTYNSEESFEYPLKLLDVGSCYNPFNIYPDFDVLAIDLCPANNTVYQCDILKVSVGPDTIIEDHKILQLNENHFGIVTFCFVLEYIPTSDLRIQACEKAYNVLKFGGLLIITTPDSKHKGANSRLMKCWQYTLALMGFTRIKYDKSRHMHCMAFRKSLHKQIAVRWATIHKTSYMNNAIHIPQDFTTTEKTPIKRQLLAVSVADFKELPFGE